MSIESQILTNMVESMQKDLDALSVFGGDSSDVEIESWGIVEPTRIDQKVDRVVTVAKKTTQGVGMPATYKACRDLYKKELTPSELVSFERKYGHPISKLQNISYETAEKVAYIGYMRALRFIPSLWLNDYIGLVPDTEKLIKFAVAEASIDDFLKCLNLPTPIKNTQKFTKSEYILYREMVGEDMSELLNWSATWPHRKTVKLTYLAFLLERRDDPKLNYREYTKDKYGPEVFQEVFDTIDQNEIFEMVKPLIEKPVGPAMKAETSDVREKAKKVEKTLENLKNSDANEEKIHRGQVLIADFKQPIRQTEIEVRKVERKTISTVAKKLDGYYLKYDCKVFEDAGGKLGGGSYILLGLGIAWIPFAFLHIPILLTLLLSTAILLGKGAISLFTNEDTNKGIFWSRKEKEVLANDRIVNADFVKHPQYQAAIADCIADEDRKQHWDHWTKEFEALNKSLGDYHKALHDQKKKELPSGYSETVAIENQLLTGKIDGVEDGFRRQEKEKS